MSASTIRKLMTPHPFTVAVDTSLAECGTLMIERRVRHLPVVDAQGALVGLVTDFAVFERGGLAQPDGAWFYASRDDENLTAGDIATKDVPAVQAHDPLAAVLHQQAKARSDIAVVVDEDRKPIGVVTEHDMVRVAAHELSPVAAAWRKKSTGNGMTIPASMPLDEVKAALLGAGRHHAVVVDGDALVGVLSWRDLADAPVLRKVPTAADVAQTDPVHTIPTTATMLEAAMLMSRLKIGCLPVLDDDNRVVGMVGRRDVIRLFAQSVGSVYFQPA